MINYFSLSLFPKTAKKICQLLRVHSDAFRCLVLCDEVFKTQKH